MSKRMLGVAAGLVALGGLLIPTMGSAESGGSASRGDSSFNYFVPVVAESSIRDSEDASFDSDMRSDDDDQDRFDRDDHGPNPDSNKCKRAVEERNRHAQHRQAEEAKKQAQENKHLSEVAAKYGQNSPQYQSAADEVARHRAHRQAKYQREAARDDEHVRRACGTASP